MPVGVLDGGANLPKERESSFQIEPSVFAVPIDRLPVNRFHDEIRGAVLALSRIQKSGDVGMRMLQNFVEAVTSPVNA